MAHPPDFYLFLTDGDPAHLPSIKEIQQDYKPTDDYGLTQKALSIFATEMMKRLDRKIKDGESEKPWFFVAVPPISERVLCRIFALDEPASRSSSLSLECVT